jgi:hypothetical protein
MKTKRFFILMFLLAFGFKSRAQTASNYIAQGRAYLAASNLVAANLSFSNALVLSPTDPTGNVFYAATQLLILPSQPAGSNFLTRWGVPVAGRNIYDWTALLPKDTNGVPLAPAGVDANEATSLLRTNILAVVIAAEADLGMVTNTNFTLALTAQETASTAVTLDYGDIQMLRAMLQAGEYLIYNTYDWNLNAQLTTIRSFYTNDQFSISGLLTNYPSLFTFAATNDLINAKTAFTNGANDYLAASQFIYNRPPGTTYLFNLDDSETNKESKFRLTLTDLENSLNGMVTLEANPAYSVYLPSQFTGTHPPRSFLPKFYNQGFIAGSLPDPTFGGLIYGETPANIELSISSVLTPFPNISPTLQNNHGVFTLPVYGILGRGYVVQSSADLQHWNDLAAFVSFGEAYNFSGLAATNGPRMYYRVADRTENMPAPPNDDFTNRTPLTGLGIVAAGYNNNATLEAGEPTNYNSATVWWSWTAHTNGLVAVSLNGSTSPADSLGVNVYTGTTLTSLTRVSQYFPPSGYYYGGAYYPFVFQAVSGTTYQIQVGASLYGSGPEMGGIQLHISTPPLLTVLSPSSQSLLFSTPTNISISATANSLVDPVTEMLCTLNGSTIASTTNLSLSFVYSNVTYGNNGFEVSAINDAGVEMDYYFTVDIPPVNDAFANRLPLSGLPASATGSNEGATTEAGEPIPANTYAGASVWWSWTAPSNGIVSVTAALNVSGSDSYSVLGVYTGTSVSALTAVGTSGSIQNGPAAVTFNASAGVHYQIAVEGMYGEQGAISLSIAP